MPNASVMLFGYPPENYDVFRQAWVAQLEKINKQQERWGLYIIAVSGLEEALHALKIAQRIDIAFIANTARVHREELIAISETLAEAMSTRENRPLVAFEEPGVNILVGKIFTSKGVETSYKTVPELALASLRRRLTLN